MRAEVKYRNAVHKFELNQKQINGINYLIDRKTEQIYEQLTDIEDNEFKITHYQIIDISGTTTGSITFPQGASLDTTSLGSVNNAVLSTVNGSNQVTYETPLVNGSPITANLSSDGSWMANNTYANPVALIYSVTVTQENYATWSSIEQTGIIDLFNLSENVSISALNISTNFSAVDGNVLLVTTGATDKTISLPDASTNVNAFITVKKVDLSAGKVIIDGFGTDTIDGDLTITITSQYESVTLICDGVNWSII